MTCRLMGNVIVCGPPPGVYRRAILRCPECKRRHRFVIRWDGAWYGTTEYGSCGDYWQEDWRGPRPARRGWREEARAQFRAMWDNAPSCEAYERYVRADRNTATARTDRSAEKAFRKRATALELIRRERAA